jgi:hypothetical protein
MRALRTLVALPLLSAAVAAQVSPGDSARLTIGGAPMVGLEVVDADGDGSATPVAGIPAGFAGLNAGVIDPTTGELWAVGVEATAYRVVRITLSGSSVLSATLAASVAGTGTGFSGIDLDRDGNAMVCDNRAVWKVDRATGAVTPWTTGTIPGEMNALVIDRATNTMWTVGLESSFTPGAELREYDLDAGPSDGVVALDPPSAGLPTAAAGMVLDGQGGLYVGAWDGLYRFTPSTGTTQVLPISGVSNEMNGIDLDAVSGLLHCGGGTQGNGTYSVIDAVTQTGVAINDDYLCPFDASYFTCLLSTPTVAAVCVNDFLHTTSLFPRVASHAAGFTLEASAHGNDGDLGAVAIAEVNGAPLPNPLFLGGLGVCDLGGNVYRSLDVAPGALDTAITSVGVQTGTYDAATGVWTLGGVETLALVP